MRLVDSGLALQRYGVMHNNFIIVGPASDPARARSDTVANALRAIADTRAPFISRGDDSGTHRREMQLWKASGIDPLAGSGQWYFEAGVGMGDALLIAAQKDGYILTDRGTYLRFQPRLDLVIICEGDPPLINNYGVTVMKGERSEAAARFADWIIGVEGQQLIGKFGRAEFGHSLFTPSAHGAALHDTIPTGER
jgi:tungstate transport system substrate-binding protein